MKLSSVSFLAPQIIIPGAGMRSGVTANKTLGVLAIELVAEYGVVKVVGTDGTVMVPLSRVEVMTPAVTPPPMPRPEGKPSK